MARVNRYTNLTGPQFDPLSFQKQSLVPMQLRKQQDALEEAAGKLGAIDAKRLAVDDPYVKEIIGGYEQEIADYADRLQAEGFNNLSKQGLRDLARKRKDLLSPTGALGKAEIAYKSFQANKKELGDMYKKGKISADKYELGLKKALNEYNQTGGVAKEGSYNAFTAIADEDINKKAREIALDIQRNPRKIESLGFTSRTLPDGTKRYYDTKTGREYTEKNAIAIGVEALLKQDPDVVNDLTQRQQLGMIKDPNAFLKGLGQTYEALYSKDNRTASRSGFFNPMEIHNAKQKIEEAAENAGVPYVYDPVKSKEITNQSLLDNLADVARGKTKGGKLRYILTEQGRKKQEEAKKYGYVARPQRSDFFATREPVNATMENSLSPKEIERVNKLYERITTENGINLETDNQSIVTDKMKAKVVGDYLTSFKDVQYSNPIVKPLTAKGPMSSALLLDTRNINRTNREVMNEIQGGRTKLWDKKGNPIEAKDLPDNMTIEYIGYVSPTNILPKFKNANKDQSVAPHVIQVMKDNKIWKEVYASRGEYETRDPSFKAYEIIKETTNKGITLPGLSETYEVDKSSPLFNAGIKNYKVKYDPRTRTYDITSTLRDGRVDVKEGLQPEQYESFWYDVFQIAK